MSLEIILTYAVLLLAVTLFVTEKLRTDLVAVLIMVILPWTGVITVTEAFSGFASEAVISIMGVMLLGYGVERAGVMTSVAEFITKKTGEKEKNVMVTSSATLGVISSFMQNIGSAALFLPALRKIAKKAGIPASKLIMPMGYAAILGGTLTMVASGPLIILNDLLGDQGLDQFHLFSVTPIGIALLGAGILYFYLLGRWVLPKAKGEKDTSASEKILENFDIPDDIHEVIISEDSSIADKTIAELDIWETYHINIVALSEKGSHVYSPWRKTRLQYGQKAAVLGREENVKKFAADYGLHVKSDLQTFSHLENDDHAGFAEIVIPPKSKIIGRSLSEIGFRKNFKLEPVVFITRSGKKAETTDEPFEAGQEMIVFGRWEDIGKLRGNRDFAVISDIKKADTGGVSEKKLHALGSVAVAISLVMAGFELPISFFTGAMMMILLGVIPKDEIYPAIDWKTVFLLAGLIPLGTAFENSGAAELTATAIIDVVGEWGTLPILVVIGIITMLFSLFMSNVAATVLLVPLVIMMADSFGINPAGLALLVGVSASNSFILPTHQVNAFIMGPGGYRNKDYMKAGSLMSVIFLIVSVLMVYLFFI